MTKLKWKMRMEKANIPKEKETETQKKKKPLSHASSLVYRKKPKNTQQDLKKSRQKEGNRERGRQE